MGKKDKKKKKNVDPNKKSELQAKKAAKADKSALKRLAKESRNSGDKTDGADAVNAEQPAAAEDLDALIASFQTNRVSSADAQDDAVTEHVLPSGTYPPPRANFSLHSLEGSGSGSGSSGDWVLFGGEYYNGQENSVYNDCFHCASKRTQNEDTGHTASASTWTRYQQDTAPHPRCAHSSFAYRNELYVWGGEIATSSQFFHHRDFWKYNPAGKRWTELTPAAASSGTTKTKLKPNPPPSPRSGCATLVYRHYALFFGGFYEASTETKWYNDLHIYDLSTNVWSGAIQYDGATKLATTTGKIPGVRSNCVLGHFGDTAFLLGGFCKISHQSHERGEENVPKAEGYIYGDVWSLNLKTLIAAYEHTTSNGSQSQNPDSKKGGRSSGGSKKMPTTVSAAIWERLKKKGDFPSPPRAGMGFVIYKHRILLFGGVNDVEGDFHAVKSVFYNDLRSFDMLKRRFFSIGTNSSNTSSARSSAGQEGKTRRRAKPKEVETNSKVDDPEDDDSILEMDNDADDAEDGWDLERLRANMFAFIDADGNVVYEKIDDDENENDVDEKADVKSSDDSEIELDEEKDEEKEAETDDETDEEKEEEKDDDNEADSKKDETETPNGKSTNTSSSKQNTAISPKTVTSALNNNTPLPRMNARLLLHNNHTVVLYGGLVEVGDREVTLDDCWTLDLRSKAKHGGGGGWKSLQTGTMNQQVWKDVDVSDDDSYGTVGSVASGSRAIAGYGGTELDTFAELESDDEIDGDHDQTEDLANESPKPSRTKTSLRTQMVRLRQEYGLDNEHTTPQFNETVAEFYARTSEYWMKQVEMAAHSGDIAATTTTTTTTTHVNVNAPLSAKETKKLGFGMARERFDAVQPILERWKELVEQQQCAEGNSNEDGITVTKEKKERVGKSSTAWKEERRHKDEKKKKKKKK